MNPDDRKRIVDIISAITSPFLATIDGYYPMVRPVSPIVEDDMIIWITTNCDSRKVKQVQTKPNISLAFVEHPGGDRSATIGRAEIVDSVDDKKRVW